jgi:outer membrane protein
MLERIGRGALIVCAAVVVLGQAASAQVKMGVINMQRAVFESAEIKKADAEMQARFKPRMDQVLSLQNDLNAISEKLQSGKLSQADETALNTEGTRKQRDLTRINEDLQADVERERNDILSKSSRKMTEIVRKLAEGKGLDLVVDTATATYYKPALDLTDEAIKEYDKVYPVTAAAPAAPAKK